MSGRFEQPVHMPLTLVDVSVLLPHTVQSIHTLHEGQRGRLCYRVLHDGSESTRWKVMGRIEESCCKWERDVLRLYLGGGSDV